MKVSCFLFLIGNSFLISTKNRYCWEFLLSNPHKSLSALKISVVQSRMATDKQFPGLVSWSLKAHSTANQHASSIHVGFTCLALNDLLCRTSLPQVESCSLIGPRLSLWNQNYWNVQ